MSKELTEQWRNGTLKTGDYYITTKGLGIDDVLIGFYEGELQQFDGFCDCSIKEVLAPVPSYEEWQSCDKCAYMLIDVNNKWLKTIKENKRLQEQLAIAINALKEYEDKQNWDIRGVAFMKYNKGFTIARKALKEMEGVK